MAIKTSTDLIIAPAHALGVIADVDYALRTRVVRIKRPADAAANTATEHLLFLSEAAIIINSCNIIPQADSAFNAANYAVLSLQTGNAAAGALATAIGARTTQTVSLVANTATAVANGLNAAVAANQRVVLNVTKVGTGVAVNIILVEVTYQLA
jgi:phage tail sheath gpL-like